MSEPCLVILAAGIGSRFGGLKQITSVDDRGHAIIDFSLFDAYRAGFRKVAFRVHASILSSLGKDVPGTIIESNTIMFENMAAYCNIKSLAYLYIVGSCNSWPTPLPTSAEVLADWRIYETEIGSKVFKG